jgi:PmbA protein
MDVQAVQDSLQETAVEAVRIARSLGAHQAEAGLSFDEGLSVTVRMGELESVERQRDRSLGITVYVDGRKGSATTTQASAQALQETASKALSIARFTTEDEYAGLADEDLMAREVPDLDLYHPWELSIDSAEALGLEAEDAARHHDARITNSEGATVSTGGGAYVYANSHGFSGGYATTSHSIGCGVVAEGDSVLERDAWYSSARDSKGLDDPAQVGEQAAQRALRRLGARQLKTCQVPVVYPAELARGLPGAMASAPFDNEGVATRKRTLVDAGVLQGYVLSSYSARRLGLVTTGNAGGIHNLVVTPTAGGLAELLGEHPSVFLVGELLGQGVNTVTGDYSRGAAGFWVEDGEIVHAVHEVTLAGNLRDCFQGIQAIGSDVDLRGTVRCGSVLVDGLTVAGS